MLYRSGTTEDSVEEPSLAVQARRLTRMHEMFFNTNLALNLAKEVYGMGKEERTQHCAACTKYVSRSLALHGMLYYLRNNHQKDAPACCS